MKRFKDIIAWQKGYDLTLQIYKLTAYFPRNEEFGLKTQLRRASASIISNIAEGFKRNSQKEKLYFYNCSQGSLEEVKCQLMLSRDLGYLSSEDYDKIDQISDEVGKVLYGWIESQKFG